MHVFNDEYSEGIKLYWDQRLQQDNMMKKLQQMKQAIKWTKEPIEKRINQLDKGWYQMKNESTNGTKEDTNWKKTNEPIGQKRISTKR